MRLAPEFSFPDYAYVPGLNEPHHFTFSNPNLDSCLNFALDLYSHGYFWETHVCLESVWIKLGKASDQADFLKAWIHCAAAQLKFKVGRFETGASHMARAQELLEPLAEIVFGFSREQVLVQIVKSIQARSKDVIHFVKIK